MMKLAIVGGGSSGWMAASILSRLMRNQLEIVLIESDQIGTVGVGEATIPPIIQFNKVLGIKEEEFLKATGGTIKLGIEFANWHQKDESYMHAFGRIGKDMGFASFHHTWLRGLAMGHKSDFWDYSLNYQVAKANKYHPLHKIPHTDMPGISHAYHFDAGLYANFLRKMCESWGVKRVEGIINKVNLRNTDGFIESLTLESGEQIDADFFVDCTGFRALLIGEALKTGYVDWRHWLPCDRAMAVPCKRVDPITPYTRSTAHSAGWQWRIPLQHRTGNGLVYSSDFLSEEQAKEYLLGQLDGEPLAEPRSIKFVTGRREKQWHKNCLSLGLSSGFLEPLESTSLHLVQSGLIRFLKLFPKMQINQTDVDEYNRQSQIEFERIRDFIILHYVLNERDEPFWQRCKEMQIPDTLEQKISLFKESGQVFREQDELFTEIAWQQVMLGQGLKPNQYHPLADSLSDEQASELLKNLKNIVDGTASKLPPHNEWLEKNCKSELERL